jgi:hypothetical protein
MADPDNRNAVEHNSGNDGISSKLPGSTFKAEECMYVSAAVFKSEI